MAIYGGGGDRTRVPRHFHVGFYVRSRPNLHTVSSPGPRNRQGCRLTSRQQFLTPGVANIDPRRSGITAGSRDSPAKSLSRGCLVRQPEPCYWQLSFGLLFAWPADQPRYATCTSACPVESNSPPRSDSITIAVRREGSKEQGAESREKGVVPWHVTSQ